MIENSKSRTSFSSWVLLSCLSRSRFHISSDFWQSQSFFSFESRRRRLFRVCCCLFESNWFWILKFDWVMSLRSSWFWVLKSNWIWSLRSNWVWSLKSNWVWSLRSNWIVWSLRSNWVVWSLRSNWVWSLKSSWVVWSLRSNWVWSLRSDWVWSLKSDWVWSLRSNWVVWSLKSDWIWSLRSDWIASLRSDWVAFCRESLTSFVDVDLNVNRNCWVSFINTLIKSWIILLEISKLICVKIDCSFSFDKNDFSSFKFKAFKTSSEIDSCMRNSSITRVQFVAVDKISLNTFFFEWCSRYITIFLNNRKDLIIV